MTTRSSHSKWNGQAAAILLMAAGLAYGAPESRQVIEVPASGGGAAINKALAALGKEGGEVVLAAGTYQIITPIIIRRDNITLRGAGPATLLRLAAKANCPVVVVGDEANTPRRGVSGICVADLTIDGNRTQQRGECWNGECDTGELTAIRSSGLVIRRAQDILVLRVTATSCRSGGLVTEKRCRRLVVRDFAASDNEFDGLACYMTEDSVFTGLDLHRNKSAGISLDLNFDHNTFKEVRMFGNGTHGIFMRKSSHNAFENLVVKNSGRAGIFVDEADGNPDTACLGNRFNYVQVRDSGGPGFQVNAASCKDTTLSHAVLEENTTGIWEAEPGLVKTEDVVVRGKGAERQVQVER